MMISLRKPDTSSLAFLSDDLHSFYSFMASHPLEMAYLLFFSPHLLSLLFFLYPLLLSTALLLLALVTISPYLGGPWPPPEFLGKTCIGVLDVLLANLGPDHESRIGLLEQLCSLVFHGEDDMVALGIREPACQALVGLGIGREVENKSPTKFHLECSKQHKNSPSFNIGIEALQDAKQSAPLDQCSSAGQHAQLIAVQQTKANDESLRDNAGEAHSVRPTLIRRTEHTRAASEGSLRKQKEWKRTLACKLYEERMVTKLCEERRAVIGGVEEMDLLWEAYEANVIKNSTEQEEDEAGPVRQLCCLQALRLSTGKMNLGVGRSGLVKMSKIFKRMAVFQSITGHRKARE